MALLPRESPIGKRVSLFVTCIVDMIYPQTGMSVVDILEHVGVEVDFPPDQTCCAQPAFNSGYRDEARTVAKHFFKAFKEAEVIVTPSGSCAAMVRHEYPLLFAPEDGDAYEQARRVASITWEFSEFLVDGLGIANLDLTLPEKQSFAIHDACHGLRGLGLGQASRDLISHLGNAELRDLNECEVCCGFGGLFSVKMADISNAMLTTKIENINASRADTIVTGDVSCLTQMNGGLSRQKSGKRVAHLADVLAQGLGGQARMTHEAQSNNFIALADIALRDDDLQHAIGEGTRTAYNRRLDTMFAHGDEHGEFMRGQAAEAKRRALRELPDLLEKAERNLQRNGFQVEWAEDAAQANQLVLDIARRHQVRTVAKSKSMLTEELGTNAVMEASGLRVVETDLGEYIIQLANETPSHIVGPAMHKTKAEIRDVFARELGMKPTDNAEEMVAFARKMLREDFLSADMGVSGGNFIIAETGSIGLVMNEGNGRMCTSLPRVHVAMVGIEKLVDTVEDYVTLTQVLPSSSTGQKMTVYTNILNGPGRAVEGEGPQHAYVILVDNGRSEIYATKYAEALACIRCGACQNACPVYRTMGGHAYGWVYGGPIGAVLTPLFIGLEQALPLPHASSLCGSCKQVCPVDIDLPGMLLELRWDQARQGESKGGWHTAMKMWAIGMTSPKRYALGGKAARAGQAIMGEYMPGPLGNWSKHRDFPEFAPKSFRQLWKDGKRGRA